MAHIHGVYDTDSHFSIDPVTRQLKYRSEKLPGIVQYDHNSQVITFEVPRYTLDGHDMLLSDTVRVHYINIDSVSKEKKEDIYDVTDLQLAADDENVVLCSWTISRNATQFVGILAFSVRFSCTEKGKEVYGLSTTRYDKLTISGGVYNNQIISEEVSDILDAWENRLREVETIFDSCVKKVELTGYATERFVRDGFQPKGNYLTEVPEGYAKTVDIPKKAADIGALPDTYTPPNQTAEQVGADPKGTAATAVSLHNTDYDSHEDIRRALKDLSDRINAVLDSDDTTLDELSEIVSYIKSNKTLIDAVTTSKVSITDIVNNLITNAANKPLSAAQGVVLAGLINEVRDLVPNDDHINSLIDDKLDSVCTQPDWNASEGEPGHVLNRPFYCDYNWLIPRTTVKVGPDTVLREVIPLNPEKNYIVTVNDITCPGYPYVVITENDELISLTAYDPDMYVMIVISTYKNEAKTTVTAYDDFSTHMEGLSEVQISLREKEGETVHKIDPKFLPDNMGGGVDVTAKPGQMIIVKTVDENGKPTEWEAVSMIPGELLPEGVPYVKHGLVEIMLETDATALTDPTFGETWVIRDKGPNLTVGETYTVIYNGVMYDCVCRPGEDTGLNFGVETFALGNFSVVGGANTGEPFAMLVFPSVPQIVIIDLSGATSVKIGIMGEGETIHKIDPRCLPEVVKSVNGVKPDGAGNVEIPVGGGNADQSGVFVNTYNAKNHGVGGDGVTNDSPALNELVTLVNANGGGTIYLEKGVYMLDSPILWKSNVNLIGDGVGLSILKTRQAEGVGTGFAAIRGLTFTANNPCVNCTFTQFTIDGSEMNITSYTSWPKGINIHFMKDCVFRDIVIQNTCATGLGIDFLENVTMDNILCYNCGRSYVPNGSEANVGGAGIGIGTKRMDKESFIIRNCVADGCGNYGIFLEDQGGGTNTNYANFVIANNIVKNGGNHGIVVKGGDRVIVSNNVVYNNAKYGFAVLENNGFLSDIIKITNNLSYENGTGFAIDCNGATKDIFFSDNVVSDCTNGILILSPVTDLEVMRNTIKKCTNPVTLSAVTLANFVYQHNILLNNTNAVNNSAIFTGDTTYNELYEYVEPVEPTAISFTESEITVTEGATKTLSVVFTPSNAFGGVTYTSDTPGVASVSGNKLTAVSVGSATITATCGELTATMTVTVQAKPEEPEQETSNLLDSSVEWTLNHYISDTGVLVESDDQATYDEFVDVTNIDNASMRTVRFDTPNVTFGGLATWRLIEYDADETFITRTINIAIGESVELKNTTQYVKIGLSVNGLSAEKLAEVQANAVLYMEAISALRMGDYEYEAYIYNDAGEKVTDSKNATTVDYFEVTDSATVEYYINNTMETKVTYINCFDDDKNFLGRTGEQCTKGSWKPYTLIDGTKLVKFRFGVTSGGFKADTMWNEALVRIRRSAF